MLSKTGKKKGFKNSTQNAVWKLIKIDSLLPSSTHTHTQNAEKDLI